MKGKIFSFSFRPYFTVVRPGMIPNYLETPKSSFYVEEEARLAEKGMQWEDLAYL